MSIPRSGGTRESIPKLPLEYLHESSETQKTPGSKGSDLSTPNSASSVDTKVQDVSQEALKKLPKILLEEQEICIQPKLLDMDEIKAIFSSESSKTEIGYQLIERLIVPSVKLPSMITSVLKRCPDEGSRQFKIRQIVYPLIQATDDKTIRMKLLGIAEGLIDSSPLLGISLESAKEKLQDLLQK